MVRLGNQHGAPGPAPRSAPTRIAALTRAHGPCPRQLAATLLCIFAGVTATALENLLAYIRKGNSEDTTQTRLLALVQANCVASIIFVLTHFMTSLVRRAAAGAGRTAAR